MRAVLQTKAATTSASLQCENEICVLQEESGIFVSLSHPRHLCCGGRTEGWTDPKGCGNGSEDCLEFEGSLQYVAVPCVLQGKSRKGMPAISIDSKPLS